MSGQVDRTKVSIEAKQRAEEDIRRDVEIAKLGAENALVERVCEMFITSAPPCHHASANHKPTCMHVDLSIYCQAMRDLYVLQC